MSSAYYIIGLTKKPGEAQMLYKKKYELNLEEQQPTKKTAEELKEAERISKKKSYEKNKEKILKQRKEYYKKNREKLIKKAKEYIKNNPEKHKRCMARYQKNKSEELNEYRKNYNKETYARNVKNKKKQHLKNYHSMFMQGIYPGFEEYVGKSLDEYEAYIESLLPEHLSMEDYKTKWRLKRLNKELDVFDEKSIHNYFSYKNIGIQEFIK